MFIAESNINNSMDLNLLNQPEYELIHSNTINEIRKSRLCCFYKNNWKPNFGEMSHSDEVIILEKEQNTIIGLYRPFKTLEGETASSNFTRLIDCLQSYIVKNPQRKLVIVGDINIDYLKIGDKSYQRHLLAEALLDFQVRNVLDQKVTEITRHRMVNRNGQNQLQTSLLDHVYTNGLYVDDVIILPLIASDHDIIKILMNSEQKAKTTLKKIIRDWRRYSKEKLLENLASYNWNEIDHTDDITTLNDRIEQAIKTAFDKTTKWATIRERGSNFVGYLNLKSLQRKRNKLYTNWKKTNNNQ